MPQASTSMNREIELKFRLPDADAFSRLQEVFIKSPKRVLNQINYFFDTKKHALRTNSLALRLRQEDDMFILSLKGDDPRLTESRNYISIRLEYEHSVSLENATKMLNHQLSPIDYLDSQRSESNLSEENTKTFLSQQIKAVLENQAPELIGSFSNRRICVDVLIDNQELVLELDETQFTPQIIHYEVELEVPETFNIQKAEEFLTNLFEKAHVSYAPSNGKAERFHRFLLAG